MNIGRLTGTAKRLIDKRGGPEALKQEAQELRRIAQGEGTLKDKARRAATALKDPGPRDGARGQGDGAHGHGDGAGPPPPPR